MIKRFTFSALILLVLSVTGAFAQQGGFDTTIQGIHVFANAETMNATVIHYASCTGSDMDTISLSGSCNEPSDVQITNPDGSVLYIPLFTSFAGNIVDTSNYLITVVPGAQLEFDYAQAVFLVFGLNDYVFDYNNSYPQYINLPSCDGTPASALNFDSTENNNVSIPDISSKLNTGQATFEAWVYENIDYSSRGEINIGNAEEGGVNIFHMGGVLFSLDNNSPTVNFIDEYGSQWIDNSSQITAGVWHHIALTIDSNFADVYIDGNEIDAFQYPYSPGTFDLSVGAGIDIFQDGWEGSVSQVQVWNRVLCPNEIQQHYTCGLTGNEQGLVADYNCNEGVIGANNSAYATLNDISPNHYNGTLNNFSLTGEYSNWVFGPVGSTVCAPSTPTVSISANTGNSICSGTQVTFTATATNGGTAPTYQWYLNNIIITDSTNATYTTSSSSNADKIFCTLTGNAICVPVTVNSDTITMNVTTPVTPLVSISANPGNIICSGTQVTFTATATNGGTAPSYQWYLNNTLIADSINSTYTRTTSANGDKITCILTSNATCVSSVTATSNAVTMTVNPIPVITVNTPAPICSGGSTTLIAGGATIYTWSPTTGLSATAGSSIFANPAITTTYTVVGTNGSCSGTNAVIVTVNPAPVITISPSSASICTGSSAVLDVTGATTYTWSPSTGLNKTTGTSVTAKPTITTTYTVTGTTASGCSAANTEIITVNSIPVIAVSPSSATICSGSNEVLNASGATVYSWSPSTGLNSTTGSSVIATPPATTSYIVTGANGGCTRDKTVKVTVDAIPTITITPSSATICSGSSAALKATGATDYTWSPSTGLNKSTGASVTAKPTATITYTVTGTTAIGCSATNTETVTVNSIPTVIVTPSSATICSGSSAILDASGATTYSWSPSTGLNTTTGISVIATPTVTTNYTVTGANNSGCSDDITVKVKVDAIPTITITPSSATICSGKSTTLKATGAATYTWSPSTGLSKTTGASVIANPTITTTYTVAGTNSNGCTEYQSADVTVNNCSSEDFVDSSTTSGTSSDNNYSTGDNINFISNLKVYPNPTFNTTTVEGVFDKGYNIVLVVTDVLGRVIINENETVAAGIYNHQVDMSKEPSGTYFLIIRSDDKMFTSKIVKID